MSILDTMRAKAVVMPKSEKNQNNVPTVKDQEFADDVVNNAADLLAAEFAVKVADFKAEGLNRLAVNALLESHDLEFRQKSKVGKGKSAVNIDPVFYLRRTA